MKAATHIQLPDGSIVRRDAVKRVFADQSWPGFYEALVEVDGVKTPISLMWGRSLIECRPALQRIARMLGAPRLPIADQAPPHELAGTVAKTDPPRGLNGSIVEARYMRDRSCTRADIERHAVDHRVKDVDVRFDCNRDRVKDAVTIEAEAADNRARGRVVEAAGNTDTPLEQLFHGEDFNSDDIRCSAWNAAVDAREHRVAKAAAKAAADFAEDVATIGERERERVAEVMAEFNELPRATD